MSQAGRRDLAADVFRGLGLWILFVDHLEPNFWSHFTPGRFGFSDFAEIFVFFSGYINASMYGRALQAGSGTAIRKLWTRLARLYLAHIATMAACIAVLAVFAARGVRLHDPILYKWMDAPLEYTARILALLYAPHWFSLLPLYIVLAPFTLLAVYALQRWPSITLAASFIVWCVAQSKATDFPVMTSQEAWYFRPLAWQWMMVLGAATAMYWDRVKRVAQWRSLQFGALAIVAASFLLKAAAPLVSLSPLLMRVVVNDAGKARLAPFRLIHFLSLAILVIAFPWNRDKLLASPVVRLAAAAGQDSLFIYCVVLVLTIAENLLLENQPDSLLLQLGCSLAGLAVICGITLLRHKQQPASYL